MNSTASADQVAVPATAAAASTSEVLQRLLGAASMAPPAEPATAIVVGRLVALADAGTTPLVMYPALGTGSALRAATIVDLHGAHVGQSVVLLFEGGDVRRPIVMGVLREAGGWPLEPLPGQVEVQADGERLVVSATEQLVLRCGLASITLTKAGKVLVQGTHVVSQASGTNRIKGGSIQLN